MGDPAIFCNVLLMQIPAPARRSWYLLSALPEHVQSGIYFNDLQNRFVLINRAQARTLKPKTPEEAIGRSDEGDERQTPLSLGPLSSLLILFDDRTL